mmetsp:Transcript_20693/g.73105  ORF Transcript_20693/g.73105 Transcript_20693/m.73105 type:complete len:208 (+) Transcript_20693:427-1050(+)
MPWHARPWPARGTWTTPSRSGTCRRSRPRWRARARAAAPTAARPARRVREGPASSARRRTTSPITWCTLWARSCARCCRTATMRWRPQWWPRSPRARAPCLWAAPAASLAPRRPLLAYRRRRCRRCARRCRRRLRSTRTTRTRSRTPAARRRTLRTPPRAAARTSACLSCWASPARTTSCTIRWCPRSAPRRCSPSSPTRRRRSRGR